MKQLSIILPCYNQSHFTEIALKNIQDVCQFLDYELIVIDDWSFDDTQNIVANYANERLIYYRYNKNQWVTKSRNFGVKEAKWEYICVINNDMLFPQYFFDKMMSGFKEKDTMLVCPRFTEGTLDYKTPPMYLDGHIFWSCYMFKQSDKDRLFPLDTRMRVFWSDNRLSMHVKYDLRGQIKLKVDAIVHHFKSQTSIWVENVDRPIYLEIAKENGRNVVPVPIRSDNPKVDILF